MASSLAVTVKVKVTTWVAAICNRRRRPGRIFYRHANVPTARRNVPTSADMARLNRPSKDDSLVLGLGPQGPYESMLLS